VLGSKALSIWDGIAVDNQGFVYRRQERLNLAPKEEAVLHLLLSRWPAAVSKNDFAQNVWQKRPMSDESLARCIARSRQALGSDSPISIKAEYGFGYRIVLPGNNETPVPHKSTKQHPRLMDTARASAPLAETVTHCGNLITLRNDHGIGQAEALLRGVLAVAPDYMAARVMLAKCLAARVTSVIGEQANLVQEGLALLEPDVRRGTPAAGLLTQWAHLLDGAWRFKEARLCHLEAIRSFPHDSEAHYHYGWHLLATGEAHKAVEALQVATELHPFSVVNALLYARALQATGDKEAATRTVSELHDRFPDNAVAALYWITIQAMQAPSQALYDAARKIHGGRMLWPLAGSNLAYIYAQCGDTHLAWRTIREADSTASTALKAAYLPPLFALGEMDEALDRAEAVVSEKCSLAPFMLRLQVNRAMLMKSERGQRILAQFDADMNMSLAG